jgi:hypothetical protein
VVVANGCVSRQYTANFGCSTRPAESTKFRKREATAQKLKRRGKDMIWRGEFHRNFIEMRHCCGILTEKVGGVSEVQHQRGEEGKEGEQKIKKRSWVRYQSFEILYCHKERTLFQ